jgi:hypothetical protein
VRESERKLGVRGEEIEIEIERERMVEIGSKREVKGSKGET